MTVFARVADLDAEQEELLAVLERNLPGMPHRRRYKWLYRDNPAGGASAWFVCERDSGRVVGATGLFPRPMWIGDVVRVAGQVGDFAVDVTHRSLGPALLLQRATLGPVDDGTLALCYDCPPDERGMATFRRLGLDARFQMMRFVRLLRLDRLIGQRLAVDRLSAPLAVPGNLVLRYWPRPTRRSHGLELASYSGRFGEEFSALDRQVGGQLGIRSRRSAEDLNWRFRDAPLGDYRVITARRSHELVGYLVYQVLGEDALVLDLFGVVTLEEMVELLEAAVGLLRGSRIQTIQASVAPDPVLTEAVKRAGFRYRSAGPRIVSYARCSPGDPRAKSVWRFTHADVAA